MIFRCPKENQKYALINGELRESENETKLPQDLHGSNRREGTSIGRMKFKFIQRLFKIRCISNWL